MRKNVAILVVNPVNGIGLFQYLETLYENKIPYKTFAVAETTGVRTNSGILIQTDDTVAGLKQNSDDFQALVFSCGDAMPKFVENADKPFNQDMLAVIGRFAAKGHMLVGHCVAALLFDNFSECKGKKVAQHPFIKPLLTRCVGTNEEFVVDRNMFTARDENTLPKLMPKLLEALQAE
ncbi:MAG: DJ-1/PfpI family protein [Tannerellaceae bacterium]|jgi:putative intracellular protease/amidase|nr:DJ-1/PfpI family protein [Tannerellaceae bacterium]